MGSRGPTRRFTNRILYADINPSIAIEERRTLDYSGHYARSDVLRLDVLNVLNRQEK